MVSPINRTLMSRKAPAIVGFVATTGSASIGTSNYPVALPAGRGNGDLMLLVAWAFYGTEPPPTINPPAVLTGTDPWTQLLAIDEATASSASRYRGRVWAKRVAGEGPSMNVQGVSDAMGVSVVLVILRGAAPPARVQAALGVAAPAAPSPGNAPVVAPTLTPASLPGRLVSIYGQQSGNLSTGTNVVPASQELLGSIDLATGIPIQTVLVGAEPVRAGGALGTRTATMRNGGSSWNYNQALSLYVPAN